MKKDRPAFAVAYGLFACFTGLWIAASVGVLIFRQVIEPYTAGIEGELVSRLIRALAFLIGGGGLAFLGTVSVGSIGGLAMMVAKGWSLADALRFALDFTVPPARSETGGRFQE